MDLGFTREEEAFRDEVRTWLDLNLPAEWRHGGVGGYREDDETEFQRAWQRGLYENHRLTAGPLMRRARAGRTAI
jgi:hypothetical protein